MIKINNQKYLKHNNHPQKASTIPYGTKNQIFIAFAKIIEKILKKDKNMPAAIKQPRAMYSFKMQY